MGPKWRRKQLERSFYEADILSGVTPGGAPEIGLRSEAWNQVWGYFSGETGAPMWWGGQMGESSAVVSQIIDPEAFE